MIALVAGSKGQIALGRHTKIAGTIGDLHLTLADSVVGAGLGQDTYRQPQAYRDPCLTDYRRILDTAGQDRYRGIRFLEASTPV